MNIDAIIKDQIAEVQARLGEHGFKSFHIPYEFETKKTNTIGFATYAGTLRFNLAYFSQMAEKVIREVVVHEVCHLYQFKYFPHAKQAHGSEFRRLNRIFGFSGSAKINSGVAVEVARKNKVKRFEYKGESGKVYRITAATHKQAQNFFTRTGNQFLKEKSTGKPVYFTGRVLVIGGA